MQDLHQLNILQPVAQTQEGRKVPKDEKLVKIYAQLFQQKLLVEQRKNYWSKSVTQCILNSPLAQQLTLVDIANKLNMTTRSLQRRLKQEGTTFLEVYNSIQFERAKLLLEKSTLNISEISDLLGYAEPSVFRRAFKRWTGMSPRCFLRDIHPDSIKI